MSIIKDAFIEGRETNTPWHRSQAKQHDIKMQVLAENIESLAKREKLAHTLIPIDQVCPNSGKIIRSFASRLEAAKWIATNVLKRPDKNPLSITGNMEMCMRAGWKSYGYYWKIANDSVYRDYKASIPVFVIKGRKTRRFPSIKSAAEFLGVSRRSIGSYISKYGECEVDGYLVTNKVK